MLSEIKNWGPDIENPIIEEWKNSDRFAFDSKTKKKIYSIDTPPPYINAPIHIGHASVYSYQDFFARYWRMKGYEVLFPLGLDRNGLPIEIGAEKKYNVSAFKLSREEFLEYCKKLLEETSSETQDSFAKLGISFNSYKEGDNLGNVYCTDSDEYRALTQATFVELYKKGLVYEDTRINNWDSKLQTTIADSEIEYIDVQSNFNKIKWIVKETGEEIFIGTTRPELICTCGMVIFNPEDKRYKHLEGKTAISPLFEKEILIKSHSFAQIDKGTGLVMMCSAGDLTDIQFFREQNLEPKIAINVDGRMNENAGFLKGLKVKEAREKIIEKLKEKKLLVGQEKIIHRTPISERSKVEVEFIEMPEFYIKQLDVKEDIRKISKELNFYPELSRKILNDWIDSISIDWPVSRRRFYATEIPLWYAENKGEKFFALPSEMNYYQPWKEKVPKNADVLNSKREIIGKVSDSKFKTLKWIGETRVFDTWMDSSVSELYILGYKTDKSIFEKSFPVSLRPQGKEIVRTWLYYTLLRSYYETGKVPFKDVWIHNHITDEKGFKMSKSVGNTIDPQLILKEFGAEAFRMWASTEGDLSKIDLKCSKERIKAELKTINKLLNVSKFVIMFDKTVKPKKLCALDSLFIDYIEDLTGFCDKSYSEYDFYNSSIKLRYFLWETFASHYIEVVKARVYNSEGVFSKEESDSAKYSLHFLLERLLYLMHPIIPQVTTIIAKEKDIDLLSAEWPKSLKTKSNLKLVEEIIEFNKDVWKKKKEKGISLRSEIEGIKIPASLKDFEKDLKICHKI